MKMRTLNIARIDYILIICVLALMLFGAGTMYSASSFKGETQKNNSEYFLKQHIMRVAVGLVLMIIVAVVPYQVWLGLSPIFYVVSIFMLVFLLTGSPFSISAHGSLRWLKFGPVTFQPSDFARYGLILLLARVLTEKEKELQDFWHGFVKILILIGFIVIPIAVEKDLSTAVMVTLIAFLMLFFAEAKMDHLLATSLTFTTAGFAFMMSNEYQRSRVVAFIRQLMQGEPTSWQVKQSLIGFAQGGFWGRGIGNSLQKYDFLPEAHKDFIFSILGEESGFIGSVLVLGLFLLFIYRGIRVAKNAPDFYGLLLAGGITTCIGSYALINAAVAEGVLPTTGLPMPFFSFGGSSLVSHLAAIGLLINISSQSRKSYANYSGFRTYRRRLDERFFRP